MLLFFFFLLLFLEFLGVFHVASAAHCPSPLLSNTSATALLVQGNIAGLAGCSAGLDFELPMSVKEPETEREP